MRIDTAKIENYETMSAEDKLKALEEYEFETPAPKENDEVTKLKAALSKANSDAAEWKRQFREKQTEAERAEAERKEHEAAVEDELRTLRRDKSVSGYVAQYLALGYTQELALKAAEATADGDAATTIACQQEFLEAKTKELEEVRGRLSRLQADKEYNSARFKQLDDAHLRDGELEELDAEQKQLSNAESIKESFAAASALLEPEEGMSVEAALKEAGRLLEKLSSLVPDASSLAERLHSSRIEISDIAGSIVDLDSRISLSQERLEQVEDRMGLLYSLMQKHGCANVAELIEARERYAEALFDSSSLEDKAEALENELDRARKEHLSLCSRIHASRAKAAPGLAAGIHSVHGSQGCSRR